MNPMLKFLRTTLVGGVLFLVPIAALAILLEKALALTNKFVEPLAEHIPVHSIIGLKTPLFLAIGLIVLFCFLAGFVAQTVVAQKVVRGLERAVLTNLPGYEFLKRIGESMLGVEREGAFPAVLVRRGDGWQFGFQIEVLESGMVAVFIPGVPNAHAGQIYLVGSDQVVPAGVPPARVMKCLSRLGVGSSALLRGLNFESANVKPTGNPLSSEKRNHP